MENSAFVRIKSCFTSEESRSIDNLSKIYADRDQLKIKIKELLDNDFLLRISDKKILFKPNWVLHSHNVDDEICLRTHDNLLLAAAEIILEQGPSKLTIGDAPIQGCDWKKMRTKEFFDRIAALEQKFHIPIVIKDFRRVVLRPEENEVIKDRRPLSEYLIFDLGKESFLEPVSKESESNFRVTCYDNRRLAESHRLGVHKYCITKELFDADIVLSIPKIKTHQKTGMTGALKNLVGVNGDKDYLPHHRVGGVDRGGDCYPGKNLLRRMSEWAMDHANRVQGKSIYWFWYYMSRGMWKISKPEPVHQMAAGWYGNDTCWRMVMDLNKIALYGKADGTLSKEPQRTLYSLSDAIIGGQGNGPLDPEPLNLGIISFTNSSPLNDMCMGVLMGFDIQQIYMLRCAQEQMEDQDYKIFFNDNEVHLPDLKMYSVETLPAPGWVEHLRKK